MIAFFARHPTAANLIMIMAIVAGSISLLRMNTQFFPDFGIDVIIVSVEWSGASADDVDATIIRAIEPELRFLSGVESVQSKASRGRAQISINFKAFTDMQEALANVEAAVSGVKTLPAEADQPSIQRIIPYETIGRIVLSGPFSETALQLFAKKMRDQLLNAGIDRVNMSGARRQEIQVEIKPERLRFLGLNLIDVANRIQAISQDLPSGNLAGGERQVRSVGLQRDASGLEKIEILALADGRKLPLSDIANVRDGFNDEDVQLFRNGVPAIELHVQRTASSDAIEIGRILDAELAKLLPTLPESLRVERYDGAVELIDDRINLLVRNGVSGLALVLLMLFIFLNPRSAVWIAVGIPISIFITFSVMLLSGQTINMISLFALIMTIGIVVDDAIVVGEHTDSLFHSGMSADQAAIIGANRMIGPVTAATMTTLAAFLPLFLVSGVIGQIMQAIPMVTVTILLASLLESFFVLPGHMRHALMKLEAIARNDQAGKPKRGKIGRYLYEYSIGLRLLGAAIRTKLVELKRAINNAFERFRTQTFLRTLRLVQRFRHSVFIAILGALLISILLVTTGRLGFVFFSAPEGDRIEVSLAMVGGSTRAETLAALRSVEDALYHTADAVRDVDPNLIRFALISVGKLSGISGGGFAQSGDQYGSITVELRTADRRATRINRFVEMWKERVPLIVGITNLVIRTPQGGPPGRDIDIRIVGDDPYAMKAAAETVKAMLRSYPEVSAIDDTLPYGQPEDILEVTPRGRALQIDTRSLGQQLRNALDGAIALRFARGDDEVTVRVRYPQSALHRGALDEIWLRGPNGAEARLMDVVSRREQTGFAAIRGYNGTREVAVTADIDPLRASTNVIVARLERDGIDSRTGGLTLRYAGKSTEQADTFADMGLGAVLAMLGIYLVLSWIFASYSLPLIVMSIIPFGLIGVFWGHYLMGYPLSVLTMIGLMGLSGIVVNDSIVLVSTVQEYARTLPWREAIVQGTVSRLRAVLLTSLTTIGGLLPMLFETSLQARFLIPMVITLVFGLMVGTILVLIAVPALLSLWREAPGQRSGPILSTTHKRTS